MQPRDAVLATATAPHAELLTRYRADAGRLPNQSLLMEQGFQPKPSPNSLGTPTPNITRLISYHGQAGSVERESGNEPMAGICNPKGAWRKTTHNPTAVMITAR